MVSGRVLPLLFNPDHIIILPILIQIPVAPEYYVRHLKFKSMEKSVLPIIILLLGISIHTKAQIDSTIQGELSNLIIEQNSEYFIEYSHSKGLEDGLVAHFFFYKIKDKNWPYGSGFEITHPQRETPLWYIKMDGDFGPHSLQQIDINLDEKMDLFFYAGFEDVFSTYIYTANYKDVLGTSYDQSNFLKTYSNENDYSILLNLDEKKQPLILDSGYEGNVNRSGSSCFENQSELAIMDENRLTITASIKKEIVKMYEEVTGQLDKYNFDYNMPDVYPLFNTKILDPIKIFRIQDNELIEVTSEYPKYLMWRIEILKAIQKDSSENCTVYIESTIKHLESYL